MRLLGINSHFNTRGQRHLNRVRIAQRKNDRSLALHLCAIADADDIQFLGPALGHALDRVENERAGESVKRGVFVGLAVNVKQTILSLEGNAFSDHCRGLPLGAFDQNSLAFDLVLDARWKRDRLFSNSRHRFNPSYGLRVPKNSFRLSEFSSQLIASICFVPLQP